MTSTSVALLQKAPNASKNDDALQEDEYEEPKWASIRDEPRPVVVAEPSHTVTDGSVDADDQDNDDVRSTSGETIHPDAPSRSSTPRPHDLQAPARSRPFLGTATFDWSTASYISIIKIGEERVSFEAISPAYNVDVVFFYAATSSDSGPDRLLSPLNESPSVWECTIVRAHRYILVKPYCDRGLSLLRHFEILKNRLEAEHDGYQVILNEGLPRAYYGFYIDPRDAPPGMPGPMAESSGPLGRLRLRRGERLPKKTTALTLK
jgi:hypothetical protein